MVILNNDIRDAVSGNAFRVIGPDGDMGTLSFLQTKAIANEHGLDMWLVTAEPPVIKILDYGKFSYEEKRKKKEQQKKQRASTPDLKEIQIRPNTDEHDLQVKARNARRFLDDGDKVKVVVRFRGREIAHKDIGYSQMNAFLSMVGDHTLEVPVKAQERNLFCILK